MSAAHRVPAAPAPASQPRARAATPVDAPVASSPASAPRSAVDHDEAALEVISRPRPGAPPPGLLPAGTIVGDRFRIVRLLGAGAMGVVYLADNLLQGPPVALKMLPMNATEDDALDVRLLREAEAVRRIEHPNVVRVLETSIDEDYGPFAAFEYVAGESLARRLHAQKVLPVETAVDIADDVLAALEASHRAKIVHRDLKPGNVILVPPEAPGDGGRERARVLDFGIARSLDVDPARAAMRLTAAGEVVGTPEYMAPEQALDEPGQDHRVDLYAVGVMLYEMLSGALPHQGENSTQVIVSSATEEPADLTSCAPHVDPDLAALVHRAIARAPSDRFASATEFRAALGAWRAAVLGPPARASRLSRLTLGPAGPTRGRRLAIAAAAVVALATAFALLSPHGRPVPASGTAVVPAAEAAPAHR